MAEAAVHHAQIMVESGLAELVPSARRQGAYKLRLNGTDMSYIDLERPQFLAFYYMRCMAGVIKAYDFVNPPSILHIGGGAMALARHVAITQPGSKQVVVEADRGIIELVADRLPLPVGASVEVEHGDARSWVSTRLVERSTDVVIGDVFVEHDVPEWTASPAYIEHVRKSLRPRGIYMVNIWDSDPHLGQMLETLHSTFRYTCSVVASKGATSPRNLVVIASDTAPPYASIAANVSPFPLRRTLADSAGS